MKIDYWLNAVVVEDISPNFGLIFDSQLIFKVIEPQSLEK